jgi:uncharacterized protein DUF5671
MLRIRRLYFYLVLYASLAMVLVGVATLLRVAIERMLDVPSAGFFGFFVGREQLQEQTALGTALSVIGLPVWILHWRAVQGWLAGSAATADRASTLRRLYIYGVLLTTALVAYSAGRDLLEHVLALALGQGTGSARVAGITGTVPFALAAGLLWSYHWRLAATDRRLVDEDHLGATLRRWYLYAMLVFGVLPLAINVVTLGQRTWEYVLGPTTMELAAGQLGLARTLASSGATIVLALSVWLGHQIWSQAMVAAPVWHGEDERRSILRKVYLYGMVLVSVAWALINASELVRFAVASALGIAPASIAGAPVVVALGGPLFNTVVFAVVWAFYWQAMSREAVAASDIGRQAGVRRLYFYLVSAIALAFVGWSVASLLRLGTDVLLQPPSVDPTATRGELARQVSWLLIGVPVWLFHWRRSQASTIGGRGLEETRATTRRWYLYVVAFAGVVVLLISGAQIVYEVALVALGRAAERELMASLSHAAVHALVAGVVLWYHWYLVLRADLAALRTLVDTSVGVAVIGGLDRAAAERLDAFVRTSLEGTRTRIYWTDPQHTQEAVAQALHDR